MKTVTRTEQVGEHLGPIDWTYDFAAHGWTESHGGINPALIPAMIERLKQLEHGEWQATTDGGWPRCGWGKVIAVGMYDGWPHWKPTPSVLICSPLGSSWHPWYSVTDIRPGGPVEQEREG